MAAYPIFKWFLVNVLILLLSTGTAFSQDTTAVAKIREKLARIPANSEVELRLYSGAKLRGRLLSFDTASVNISSVSTPVSIAEVRTVKHLREPGVWSPLWGFGRTWKTTAIMLGVILLVGVYAAKNTR